MKDRPIAIAPGLEIRPGEIWSLTGPDGRALGAWCAAIARDEELEDSSALLSFAQQEANSMKTGWPQARYYADDGESVREFLSYNRVWDVNPFEVGARRPETRAAFRARMERIVRLLDLRRFYDSPVIALSNGETRRLLLARALAKGPRLLILDDPAAGLDAVRRAKLKDAVAALAKRGVAIVFAYRHADEAPESSARWLTLSRGGRLSPSRPPSVKTPKACDSAPRPAKRRDDPPSSPCAPAVVEIRDLNLAFGKRVLFRDFSWTVRRGERWVLRGENGSGKTTLMALVTGDSPLAYASDIRVFGQRREVGMDLGRVRRRMGLISPEMQAYLGKGAEELVADALSRKPELLILDEPFLNMDVRTARRASRRISAYLRGNPRATAILICHRSDEAPRLFNHAMDLGEAAQTV